MDTSVGVSDVVWHCGLKPGVADHQHHRTIGVKRYIQKCLKGFGILVVLMQRVLEFAGVPVNLLRPGFLVGYIEYPDLHVLGF